jgi:hypothetical protein
MLAQAQVLVPAERGLILGDLWPLFLTFYRWPIIERVLEQPVSLLAQDLTSK